MKVKNHDGFTILQKVPDMTKGENTESSTSLEECKWDRVFKSLAKVLLQLMLQISKPIVFWPGPIQTTCEKEAKLEKRVWKIEKDPLEKNVFINIDSWRHVSLSCNMFRYYFCCLKTFKSRAYVYFILFMWWGIFETLPEKSRKPFEPRKWCEKQRPLPIFLKWYSRIQIAVRLN